jgi:FkbM family methyltransferase
MKRLSEIFPKITHPDFFFVQVGANDGITCDPLYEFIQKYNWKGLFIEPGDVAFDKLTKLYEGEEGYLFEHCVISDVTGKITFHEHKRNGRWSGVNPPRNKKRCNALEKNSYALKDILSKHDIKEFDLLQIDAEGLDDKIVKQVETLEFKPKIINFEFSHMSREKKKDLMEFLKSIGYSRMHRSDKRDIICIRDNVIDYY